MQNPPPFMLQPEYVQFRQAYAEGKAPLVVVCGSGLSRPSGLPDWMGLRSKLEECAKQKVESLNQMGDTLMSPRLSAILKQDDPWIAFKLLKELLTPAVFDREIERLLSPGDEISPPLGYQSILSLAPQGVVTLNLDRFAGDAFSETSTGRLVAPVYGNEIARKWSTIQDSRPFLVYLHGTLNDPSTWVLTQDDLEFLNRSAGHTSFLSKLFLDHLVLFVGVNPDDIALSGKLLALREAGFRPRNLFWFTTRHDDNARKWASDMYVSTIQYEAHSDSDHQQMLSVLVEDCYSFRPVDEIPPLLPNQDIELPVDVDIAPDPETLAQEEPDFIRVTLSRILNSRLNDAAQDNVYSVYREVCKEYEFAINRAFFKSSQDKYRSWFGYRLDFPEIGSGNFGRVFSATPPEGEVPVVAKIMHESIFWNDDMLGGFRRGVSAMNIVTDNNITGMVPIIGHFELPPTIIMPFVGGLSLEDALEQHGKLEWPLKLTMLRRIADIVRQGHALPQTVMHRDLKPSNIMIQNYEYDTTFDPEIVVLDFDMSWHKGSSERDVVFESRNDFGYLAPEQTNPKSEFSARNTKVDSYGLGMLVYFTLGGVAPRPNEGLSDQWPVLTLRAARSGYTGEWRSAPARLARLIVSATTISQSARVDFATMARELAAVESCVNNPGSVSSPDYIAEELVSRLDAGIPYSWDDRKGVAEIVLPSGVSLKLASDFTQRAILLTVSYQESGMSERANIGKYLMAAYDKASSALAKAGWESIRRHTSMGGLQVDASIAAETAIQNLGVLAKSVDDCIQSFRQS